MTAAYPTGDVFNTGEAELTTARPRPRGLGVIACLPPALAGNVFNTSHGRADNRSSQTSRSGSHGVTAAYPPGDVFNTSGAELTTARPRPRGLGVMACR